MKQEFTSENRVTRPFNAYSAITYLLFAVLQSVAVTECARAILTLCYPKVSMATLRVTSLVGAIIGVYNMLANFITFPSFSWRSRTLYVPLLTISVYGLILSLKQCH